MECCRQPWWWMYVHVHPAVSLSLETEVLTSRARVSLCTDSYRLCPLQTATQPPGYPLDETCFQAHALEFEGDTQWFQFGSNRSSRAMYGPIKAMRTSEGTWPEGSQWTRKQPPSLACWLAGWLAGGLAVVLAFVLSL